MYDLIDWFYRAVSLCAKVTLSSPSAKNFRDQVIIVRKWWKVQERWRIHLGEVLIVFWLGDRELLFL
jgi:hypothetical protein